ncbi:MAG: hypothetical protein ACLFWB_00475 [Armatimonadota bacterium]
MRLRHILSGLVIAVALLAGCSGSDVDYEILQNVMPLRDGTRTVSDCTITTYFGVQEWTVQGTSTREVVGPQQITIDGEDVGVTVVQHDFPNLAPPDLGIGANHPMQLYVNYLFSDVGGLRNWLSYFQQVDRDNDGDIDRIVRLASGPVGGEYAEVPDVKPHILKPFPAGHASNNSHPITSVPFYCNNETLNNSTCVFNSQYRLPELIFGQERPFITCTQRVAAEIEFNGETGPFNGVIKTGIAENVGPIREDIDYELRLGGHWVQFFIEIESRTITPQP